jgi:hypothetical protein
VQLASAYRCDLGRAQLVHRLAHHRKIAIVAETTKQQAFGYTLNVSSLPSATWETRNAMAGRESS